MDLEFCQRTLELAGVVFAPGLTESELTRAENHYAFRFPPDLKELLMFALPISSGWPNWREVPNEETERMMIWPYEGICFDIAHGTFWLEEWGPKPTAVEEACAVAKKEIDAAPTLIPICGHRFIPDEPMLSGNPVFSVYQTDIIYYGADLENYLHNEFYYYFQAPYYSLNEPIRQIDLWSLLAKRNG